MDRGTWQAVVQRMAKSWTGLRTKQAGPPGKQACLFSELLFPWCALKLCTPKIPMLNLLTPTVVAFGKGLWEIIRVRLSHEDRVFMWDQWLSRRIPGTEEPSGLPSMGSHRVGHDWSDLAAAAAEWGREIFLSTSPHQGQGRTHREGSFLQATKRVLPRTWAWSLISNFQPPELWENKLVLLNPHSLWYFVMAAWAKMISFDNCLLSCFSSCSPLHWCSMITSWIITRNIYNYNPSCAQSCLTLCDPMDCSPLVSSVHEIFHARILKWIVIYFPRESSQPRDRTRISCISCIAGRFFTQKYLAKN